MERSRLLHFDVVVLAVVDDVIIEIGPNVGTSFNFLSTHKFLPKSFCFIWNTFKVHFLNKLSKYFKI